MSQADRTSEEIMAAEKEVLSDAVVAALHALMDIASTGTESADTRMEAASRILSFAWDGPYLTLMNQKVRKWPMVTAQRAEETRAVDAETGAQKGVKLARFDLVPARAYWELAEHFGKGSLKYEDRNWEKGYDWGLSIGALERHLIAFKAGEDIDPETGSKHIIAVAWHAFALATFMHTNLGKDDRSIDAGLPETLLRNLQYWAEVYAREAQAAPEGGSDG